MYNPNQNPQTSTPTNASRYDTSTIPESGGAGFELPPEGIYSAFIVAICDKGQQERRYQDKPPKMSHVLQLFWGFSTWQVDEKTQQRVRKHWTQGREVTRSLRPNARLTQIACAALQVPKISKESLPNLLALLGKATTIEVQHYEYEKNGFTNTRAQISAVLRASTPPDLDPGEWRLNRGTYEHYLRSYGNFDILPGLQIEPPLPGA